MAIEQMYKVIRRENANWGVDGYEVPRKYEDPIQIAKNREYLVQKKGEKSKQYLTKKGHFLDFQFKALKGLPAPNKYDTYYKWVSDEKNEKARPKSAPKERGTFIDAIFLDKEKKRCNPGVGTYDVTPTLETQKEKLKSENKSKIKYGDRPCFNTDTIFLSNCVPGMGQYVPRPILPKLKMNGTKPEFWIKKHQEQKKSEKIKKSNLPDVGTYKHHPVNYETFGKTLMNLEKKDIKTRSVKFWGTEIRFKQANQHKSKMILNVPEPGRYETMAHWPGKMEALKKDKSVNWMNRVSKGITQSIYH